MTRTLKLGIALLVATAPACNRQKTNGDGGATDGDVVANVDFSACANSTARAELAPLDILIALDTSHSMDYEGKWPAVRSALKTFVNSHQFDGLGVGLQYFPIRQQCNVDAYAVPAVSVGIIPTVSPAIVTSLEAQRMSGGTPMVPVMQGVVRYVKQYATDNPTHKLVILLATDGIPDDTCLAPPDGGVVNTLANVVQITGDAAQGVPKIPTFVIGVGAELTGLDDIAQAGGSGTAILVDTAQNVEAAFLNALTQIRRKALACDYEIPTPASDVINFSQVNVNFRTGSTVETFINVGTQAGCATTNNGWYYDDVNAPKKVLICETACDRVTAATDGVVDVIFGCDTLIL